jgi:hypothetical protein
MIQGSCHTINLSFYSFLSLKMIPLCFYSVKNKEIILINYNSNTFKEESSFSLETVLTQQNPTLVCDALCFVNVNMENLV